MREFDILKQAFGTPASSTGKSSVAEQSSQLNTRYQQAIKELPTDLTKSAAPELMQGRSQGTLTNMVNTFRNAVDEIEKGSATGKKLEYDRQIDELSKRLDEVEAEPDAVERERQKYAIRKEIEKVKSNPDYKEIQNTIAEEERDIAERKVDLDFQMNTDAYRLSEDKSMFNTIQYELPQLLGGSFSDIKNQFGAIVAPTVTRKILEMGLTFGGRSGPLSGYVAAAVGVAAAASSMYYLYNSRKNETDAEVSEAFDERYRNDRLAAEKALGKELSEDNPEDAKVLRSIRLKAYEGLDELRAQNMKQMMGDALETVVLAAPWGKSLSLFKGINRVGARLGGKALSRALTSTMLGRISAKAAGVGATMLGESVEELNQYTYKKKYVEGRYDEGMSMSDEIADALSTNLSSARFSLTGESGKGYEEDPEYAYASRSGAMLGGLMGGASMAPSSLMEELSNRRTAKKVESLQKDIIDTAKQEYRQGLYDKYVLNGKGEELRRSLVRMAEIAEPENRPAVLDEIDQLDKAMDINDHLDTKLYGYNSKFKPVAFAQLHSLSNRIDRLNESINTSLTDYTTLQSEDTQSSANAHGVGLKAQLEGVKRALNDYYGKNREDQNDEKFEIALQDQLRVATENYTNYLKDKNLKNNDVTSLRLDAQIEAQHKLTNDRTDRDIAKAIYDEISTTKGLHKFLNEGTQEAKPSSTFDIDKPDLATYNRHETRHIAKERYKERNNKISQELYNMDITDRLESGEDVTSILQDINEDKVKLTDANLERIKELRAKKNTEASRLATLEAAELAQLEDFDAPFSEEDAAELKELQDKGEDYTAFNAASAAFNPTAFKEGLSITDESIKHNFMAGFGKEAANLKYYFDTDTAFSRLAQVERERKRLEGLVEAIKDKENLDKGEIQYSYQKLKDQIADLIAMETVIRGRIDEIKRIDSEIPNTTAEQAFAALGINKDLEPEPRLVMMLVNTAVKKAVGEVAYNAIIAKAKAHKAANGVLLSVHADAIVELLNNASPENIKEVRDAIATAKDDIANQLIASPGLEDRDVFTVNDIAIYKANPDRGFDEVLAQLRDSGEGGFDTTADSSINKFLLNRNITEFRNNATDQDRGNSPLTKETLLSVINNHYAAAALYRLDKEIGSNYRQIASINAEITIERKLAEDRKSGKTVPTPSNEQLRSIRELLKFVLSPMDKNNVFANWAYMKGFAGTGKTSVVMPWVMHILGIKPENIYTIGHLKHSAETIQRSLGTATANTIEQAIDDLTNKTIPKGVSLIVFDEVGGATKQQLVDLSKAVVWYNKDAETKVKVIALGDPNQVTPEGLAPIERPTLLPKSERVTMISPLTIRFRSDIEELVDLQDLFINQSKDLTTGTIPTKSNTNNPTEFKEELLGANTAEKNFDEELIKILKNRPVSDRSRLVIVSNAEEKARYETLLSDEGITGIEVLTYLEAQGTTRDEVFINIHKKLAGIRDTIDFNTAVYTATSRATKYVFLNGFKGTNDVSPTIAAAAEQKATNKSNRSGEFMDARHAELTALEDSTTAAPKANRTAPVANANPTTPTATGARKEIDPNRVVEEPVPGNEFEEDRDEAEDDVEEEIETTPVSVPTTINSVSVELRFPTYSNIHKTNKSGKVVNEGVKAGDEVSYVLEETPKGLPGRKFRITVVAKVDDSNYRQVAVLSEEELDNPPAGLEELYATMKAETLATNPPRAQFRPVNGLLHTTRPIKPFATGKIGKAQPLQVTYEGEERPYKFANVFNKFVKTFFNTNRPANLSELERTAIVRKFTKKQAAKILKETSATGQPFRVIPGVHYLHIENPAVTSKSGVGMARDIYIRLNSAKLNSTKHSEYVKDILDFISRVEQLENLLTRVGSPHRLGSKGFSELVRATTAFMPNLLPAGLKAEDFKAIKDLTGEVHDLIYTYEEETLKPNAPIVINAHVEGKGITGTRRVRAISDDNKFADVGTTDAPEMVAIEDLTRVPHLRRVATKAQRAFNEIAKANFEANGVILRNYVVSAKGSSVPQGRRLLLEEEDLDVLKNIHPKVQAKYLTKLAKKKGVESLTLDQLSDDEKIAMADAMSHPLDLQTLKDIFSFDGEGNSAANGDFGLRVPTDIEFYSKNMANKGDATEFTENFDGITPTSVFVVLEGKNPTTPKPPTTPPTTTPGAPAPDAASAADAILAELDDILNLSAVVTAPAPAAKPAATQPAPAASAAKALTEAEQLLNSGVESMRPLRQQLLAEGKTVDEVDKITYDKWLATKDGKRYTELTKNKTAAPTPAQSNLSEEQKGWIAKDKLREANGGVYLQDHNTYNLIEGTDGKFHILYNEGIKRGVKAFKFNTKEEAKQYAEKNNITLLEEFENGWGFTAENKAKYDAAVSNKPVTPTTGIIHASSTPIFASFEEDVRLANEIVKAFDITTNPTKNTTTTASKATKKGYNSTSKLLDLLVDNGVLNRIHDKDSGYTSHYELTGKALDATYTPAVFAPTAAPANIASTVDVNPVEVFPAIKSTIDVLEDKVNKGIFAVSVPGRPIAIRLNSDGSFASLVSVDKTTFKEKDIAGQPTPEELIGVQKSFNIAKGQLALFKSPLVKKLAKLSTLLGGKSNLVKFLNSRDRKEVGTPLNDISNYIQSLYGFHQDILPTLEAVLDAEIARLEGGRELNKAQESQLGNSISIRKARRFIRRMIPGITNEEMQFLDTLQMSVVSGGRNLWGLYRDGILHYERGTDLGVRTGVIRHEVFHKIWAEFLTQAERNLIIATIRRDVPSMTFASEVDIEEYVARLFQAKEMPSGLGYHIKRILNKIKRFFGFASRNISTLDKLFDAIDAGDFSDRKGVAGSARELVKVLEQYGTTENYRAAKNLMTKYLSTFMANTKEIVENPDGSLSNVPMPLSEARVATLAALNVMKTKVEGALQLEGLPEAKRLELLMHSTALRSLTKLDKKDVPTVFNDLLRTIYPTVYLGRGETFKDTVETEEEIINEINGVQDYLIEADRQDHESNTPQPIKDFLAIIMDAKGIIINPKAAYAKLLAALQNVDTSSLTIMMEQIGAKLSDRNTNPATAALYQSLLTLTSNAELSVLDSENREVTNAYFGNETTFIYERDGKQVVLTKQGSSQRFFQDIKAKTDKDGYALDYTIIKDLYKQQVAQETLRALVNTVGSLRAKNVLQGIRTYQPDGSIAYRYVTPREQGIRQAFRNSVEDAIIENFSAVKGIKALFDTASTPGQQVLAMQRFFKTIGIHEIIAVTENNVSEYFEAVTGFMDSMSTVGDKTTYVNEAGDTETIIITPTYLVKKESSHRMQSLTDLISQDEAVRVISYRRLDGKKAYMYTQGSFASRVIDYVSKPHLSKTKPSFLLSSLMKLNPINNGKIRIYSYNEHDGLKTTDSQYDPVLYSDEKERDVYVRTIQLGFVSQILQGSDKETPKYSQFTYVNSNKPTANSAKMDILKEKEIRELVGDAIQQMMDRIPRKIKSYNINASALVGLSESDVADLRAGKITKEEAVEMVMLGMEDGALRLAKRLINRKVVLDTNLAGVYAKLAAYIKNPPMIPDSFKQQSWEPAAFGGKAVQVYNTKIEDILPLVHLYYMNNTINGHFLNQLYLSDLAFYKNQLDVIKRMSIAHGMGTRGYVNEDAGGMRRTARIAVAKDPIEQLGQEYLDIIKFTGKDVEKTDGAAFASPRRYRDIQKGFGRHMNIGPAMKPVYAGTTDDSVPRSMKYSLIVLTDDLLYEKDANGKPDLTKVKFPKLKALRDEMEANNLDEWAFVSGFKYGAPTELSTHDENGYPTFVEGSLVEIDNNDWRIQLNPMHDVDTTVRNPGQLTYQVDLTGKNAAKADELYDINAKLIEMGFAEVEAELNMKQANGDNKVLRERVAKSLEETAGAESQHEMLTAKDEEGEYMLPINFPTVVNKFITQVSSIVSKAAISIRFPGSKLVLQPEYTYLDGEKLKYRDEDGATEVILPESYRGSVKEGDILYLGFRIPSTGLNNAIVMKVKGFYDDKGTNVVIAPWEIVYFHGSDYDIDALYVLRKEVLKQSLVLNNQVYSQNAPIGYRDGKARYTEFETNLRAEMNIIDRNIAVQAQAGEDADDLRRIRKGYEKMLKSYYLNRAVDILIDVIKDDQNTEEVLTPVSMSRFQSAEGTIPGTEENIKEMLERILPERKTEAFNLNDATDQAKVHQDNFSGRSLVGAGANFVKAVAYMFKSSKELPPINSSVRFNKANYSTLQRFEMVADAEGNLVEHKVSVNVKGDKPVIHNYSIAETFSAIVNAAVDNVKEQILPMINMTGITSKAYMGLLAVGVPLHTAVKFMTTPGMLELSTKDSYDRGARELKELIKGQLSADEIIGLKETIAAIELTDENMEKLMQDKALATLLSGEEVEENTVSKEHLLLQYKAFEMLDEAHTVGTALSKYSGFLSILNALPIDFAGMEDIIDFYDNAMDSATGVTKDSFAIQNVNVTAAPHIAAAYSVLNKLKDFVGKVFYKHNDRVVKLSKEVNKEVQISLERKGKDNENTDKIRTEFVKYLISNIVYSDGGNIINLDTSKEPPMKVDGGDYTREISGLDAWTFRFVEDVRKAKNANPNNLFFKYLEIDRDWKTGLNKLSYTASGNLSPDEVIDVKKAFDELKEDGEYTKFQHDFVKYAALHFGLSFGSSNYSTVLPVAVYSRFAKEMEKKLISIIKNDSADKYIESLKQHFMIQLAMNNAKYLDAIRGEDKTGGGTIGEGESAFSFDYRIEYRKDITYPIFLRKVKNGDTNVYVKIDKGYYANDVDYVYYQRVGKAPNSAHYQFDNEVLNGNYSFNQVFRPNVKMVNVVDNTPDSEGNHTLPESKYKLEVGQMVALRNFSDVSRMGLVDYIVSSKTPIEGKPDSFAYTFSDGKRLILSKDANAALQLVALTAQKERTRIKTFISKTAKKYKEVVTAEELKDNWNKAKEAGMSAEDFIKAEKQRIKQCLG